ncbi:Integral membrane protein PTH11 [Pleurostoma richardsiae]|uniref:Integral membrane protein PTH11 n=1 Tax=Pleurostoma richardsiae TaxID=41990 RepID=A0AA38RW20_9PEZI|nr:Integral membrane protein PTH11 [Pleurostoma richardsiae]
MSLSSDQLAALLDAPALEPPSGVTAEFDNPPNENVLAWFVTTFCMVISTLCLFVRLYAKLWVLRKIRAEEVLMVLAYGAYWGTAYAGYGMIYTPGYYVHQWNLRNGDLIRPLYLILIYGCSYSAVLPLLKTAILLDWCRIFVAADRFKNFFWWGCMFIIGVQVTWGIACIILLNMQCVPHAAIWKFYLPSKCYDLNKVMLTSASVQVFTDWSMVLLPQRIIWGLQMNWQKKVGVSVIFGVGLLASISASLRLDTTITFAHESDTMYFIGPLLFWACAEMTCGFFILCVPCLPSIIKESGLSRKIKKVLGISMGSSGKPSNHDLVTFGGTGPASSNKKSKAGKSMNDTYFKIDEEDGGLPMGDLKTTESQERLHMQRGNNGVHITRTTQVTVTSDSRSAQSGSESGDNSMPWASAR